MMQFIKIDCKARRLCVRCDLISGLERCERMVRIGFTQNIRVFCGVSQDVLTLGFETLENAMDFEYGLIDRITDSEENECMTVRVEDFD